VTPKHMDIQELSDEGYIAEANRRFFHPLGLALERTGGWTQVDVEQVAREAFAVDEIEPSDEDLAAIWRFVQCAGFDRPFLSGVWDCRDDPGGVNFGPRHAELVARAAARIDALWAEREQGRRQALGYMVQSPEEVR